MKNHLKSRPTPKMKRQFCASMGTDGTLELLVYEEIGIDWWTGEGVTAKTVKAQIDAAGAFSSIAVRINSPGGDAFEGIAILNLLKAQKKPISVFVDGIAASAASVIAMAGDTITMGPSAMMMIHNAFAMCFGDARDMRKFADTLDKVSHSAGQAYVDRTGKSAADVKALMDEETWMGAEECVAAGFATAIAGTDDAGAAMALAKSFKSLAKMKHVPTTLKNDAADDENCDCTCQPCIDGNCEGCTGTDCTMATAAAEVAEIKHTTETDTNLSQYEARLTLLEKV